MRKLNFLLLSFFLLFEIFTSIDVFADPYHNSHERPWPGCNLVYFSQGDPAWHDLYVGDAQFGPGGCAPTCYAIISSSFGSMASPLEWGEKMRIGGYWGILGKGGGYS
ncbi:MAG: hypothetical protein LBL38_02565 [Lactobacillales bacterium]|nr:hypothetical protein [Lactobacillales bacterium]